MEEKKKIIFRQSKRIILRPLERGDIPLMTQWMNDPDITKYLGRSLPVSVIQEEKWLESQSQMNNDFTFGIIDRTSGELIGNMGLHDVSWVHRRASTGAVIGNKDYWNKGYGAEAKMLLLDFAFNALNLIKVTSSVFSFNGRSLRYLEKTGYKKEGVLKSQFFKDGQYWDEVLLAVFREDWLLLWKEFEEKYLL